MKQKYLDELSQLDEIVLKRLCELSKEPKALEYFKSVFLFNLLKGYLKKL